MVGDERLALELGQLLAGVCAAEGAPGASGAVRVGDRCAAVAVGSSGGPTDVPMELSARLRLSSMVKPFTTVALLTLADAGQIDIDGDVAGQLNAVEVPLGPTVRDLLVHAGGIRRPGYFHVLRGEDRPSVRAFYRHVGIELGFSPGTAFEYSNHGYALLGELVAEQVGVSYPDAVDRLVLDPLTISVDFDESVQHNPGFGVVNVSADVDALGSDLVSIRSLGQFPVEDFEDGVSIADGEVARLPDYVPILDAASGGWSTVEDLIKLPEAIIDRALPLKGDTAAALTTNRTYARLKPRAFGFVLDDLDGDLVAWHSGGWPGYSGTIGFCMNRQIAFAVLFNMSVEARGELGLAIVSDLS